MRMGGCCIFGRDKGVSEDLEGNSFGCEEGLGRRGRVGTTFGDSVAEDTDHFTTGGSIWGREHVPNDLVAGSINRENQGRNKGVRTYFRLASK